MKIFQLISCKLLLAVPFLYNHSSKCPINRYALQKVQSKPVPRCLSTSYFKFYHLFFTSLCCWLFRCLVFHIRTPFYCSQKYLCHLWGECINFITFKIIFNPKWHWHSNIKTVELQKNWSHFYMNIGPTCWESTQTHPASPNTLNE